MITYSAPIQISAAAWLLPVESDRPSPLTLYVYRDGVRIDQVQSGNGRAEIVLVVPAGTSPFFEVLDHAGRPSPAHPGRLTVHWRGDFTSASFRVEEFVDPDWIERKTLAGDGGGAYSWDSRWLEDVADHQFRVIAIDAAGNESSATSFTERMVRRPDAPAVTIAKTDEALTLEITA